MNHSSNPPSHPLHIALLSRNPNCYSTKRIIQAAQQRGHSIDILDSAKIAIYLEKNSLQLSHKSQPLPHYDAIIPRIGPASTFNGASVLRHFELMGVPSLNPSNSIIVSRDKLRSLQILSRHNIDVAPTTFVQDSKDVIPAIKRLGGAPVIIKLIEGTQGKGVILAESLKNAEVIIQTLQTTNQNVLIQKFVSESKGKDIRAFVVGDRVVAAMRRKAVGDEFRSNFHLGGQTEPISIPESFERTAVRSAQILGLKVAGVDMLEGKDGPVVLEVNSSPGLEGIESTTNTDVAGHIIDYLVEHTRFSDADFVQHLNLTKGYSVMEFTVTHNSNLIKKSIQDSRLRDLDIVILTINRNDQIIALPSPQETILEGDHLFCFGKKLTLKNYLPIKKNPPTP